MLKAWDPSQPPPLRSSLNFAWQLVSRHSHLHTQNLPFVSPAFSFARPPVATALLPQVSWGQCYIFLNCQAGTPGATSSSHCHLPACAPSAHSMLMTFCFSFPCSFTAYPWFGDTCWYALGLALLPHSHNIGWIPAPSQWPTCPPSQHPGLETSEGQFLPSLPSQDLPLCFPLLC